MRGAVRQITRFKDTTQDTTNGIEKIAHYIKAYDGGTGNKYFSKYYSGTSEMFSIKLDGSTYMAGNLGIGTTTPTRKLEVGTTADGTVAKFNGGAAGVGVIELNRNQ